MLKWKDIRRRRRRRSVTSQKIAVFIATALRASNLAYQDLVPTANVFMLQACKEGDSTS
jgi:hypothetical protein